MKQVLLFVVLAVLLVPLGLYAFFHSDQKTKIYDGSLLMDETAEEAMTQKSPKRKIIKKDETVTLIAPHYGPLYQTLPIRLTYDLEKDKLSGRFLPEKFDARQNYIKSGDERTVMIYTQDKNLLPQKARMIWPENHDLSFPVIISDAVDPYFLHEEAHIILAHDNNAARLPRAALHGDKDNTYLWAAAEQTEKGTTFERIPFTPAIIDNYYFALDGKAANFEAFSLTPVRAETRKGHMLAYQTQTKSFAAPLHTPYELIWVEADEARIAALSKEMQERIESCRTGALSPNAPAPGMKTAAVETGACSGMAGAPLTAEAIFEQFRYQDGQAGAAACGSCGI